MFTSWVNIRLGPQTPSVMKTFLLFLIFVQLISVTATGQSTNASFTGIILNDQNTALVGATVEVLNESTGFRTSTTTGADGRFQILQLPLGGPYTITASYVGFVPLVKNGYQLNQGDRVVVNLSLVNESTTLQNVVVTSNGLINQKARFGAATDITANRIRNLPLEGRNFQNLINLSPLALNNS